MLKLILIILITFTLLSCKPNISDQEEFHAKIVTFGTIVDVTLRGIDAETAKILLRQIETKLNRMDLQWHAWRASTLTLINAACQSGDLYVADPSTIELIRMGQDLENKTNGLFNPAFGELISLWGFHDNDPTQSREPPNAAIISKLLTYKPSMQNLHISGNTIACDNPHVKLDFGGFAKGFATESLAKYLNKHGVPDILINAGGDIYAIDDPPARPWNIALRNPVNDQPLAVIAVTDRNGVFTSGTYERRFIFNNTNYHHIIDPRTGYPSEGFISVTVIHPNASLADAAATALVISGPEHWKGVAQSLGIKKFILIDKANHIYLSKNLKSQVKILDSTFAVSYL